MHVELDLANKTRSGKVRRCNTLMTFSWAEQVKLKAQQSMLQKRLQQALQMHLQPRTSVNTESPADRTLRLLDSLLQVWFLAGLWQFLEPLTVDWTEHLQRA